MLGFLGCFGCEKVLIVRIWVNTKEHHQSGGFAGNIGHDPHMLYTLSAVQILHFLIPLILCSYIAGIQNEDGLFTVYIWAKIDTR
ncbi:hypothetical protein MKW92_049821, partial [Papaver armeniacum]